MTPEQGRVVAEICVLLALVGLALVLIGLPRIVQAWVDGRRVVREAEQITTTGDLLRLARHVEVVRE